MDFRVPGSIFSRAGAGDLRAGVGAFLRSARSRSTAASRAVTTNHATTLLPSWLRLGLSLQRRTNTSWRISSAAVTRGKDVRHQPVDTRGVPVVKLAQRVHVVPRNASQQFFGWQFFVHQTIPCQASLARAKPLDPYAFPEPAGRWRFASIQKGELRASIPDCIAWRYTGPQK